MQVLFNMTREEQIKEIEDTIEGLLQAYDQADRDDNKDMKDRASECIVYELEKLQELVNPEIKLYTGPQ